MKIIKNKIITMIMIIIIVLAASLVSAAETNPGHSASEIGGTDIADRTFQNAAYSFQDNVGIGTTSPNGNLHIKTPSSYAWADIEGLNSGLRFRDENGDLRYAFYSQNTDNLKLINYVSGNNPFEIVGSTGDVKFHDGSSINIKSDGNVGIGTTDPSWDLSLIGHTYSVLEIGASSPGRRNFFFNAGGAGSDVLAIQVSDNNSDHSVSNSKTALAIDGDKNIGIGTSSPTALLTLKSGGANAYSGGFEFIAENSANVVARIFENTVGGELGSLILYDSGVESIRLNAGSSQDSYFKEGNVGIGETNPAYPLHIATTNSQIGIENTQASGNIWRLISRSTGNFGIYDNDATAYRIFIRTNGNVGIGTTNPDANLQIYSDSSNSQIDIGTEWANNGAVSTLSLDGGGVAVNNKATQIVFNRMGDFAGRIVLIPTDLTGGSESYRMDIGTTVGGSFSEAISVLGGDVGIGTTSPDETLDVEGGIRMSSSSDCIMIRDTDNAGWTKCTALNGVLSCTTDADGIC
ncbi:hypothetical protein GF336_02495 [Candidatus Woesearchaeota archaeon]|nr:hypothetical protein [Candidatus Woesearchaeota archaeon]